MKSSIFFLISRGISFNLLIVVCLLCAGEKLNAQLFESPEITELMSRWKMHNLEHQEVTGYRVQILATVDRRQMETVKRRFENLYPEYPVQFTHNEPYFQLKTGAFLTLQKAQAFLNTMKKEYPAAILVTDLLKMDEIILYDQ